ncbi:MAG: GIY-YIG nuclease family protein [Alphaproteobacteria bacterium]|nr:GIY-YIG nuclease family protein [Alphaproteobacteria bacterium]
MKARSINIFLPDGDPDGVKMAQIAMSTIQAIAFRRNQLRRVRDTFLEIERPGVYVLIGADETEPGRLLGYIGESEGVGGRLATHSADSARSFWNDTVVLVSKDENLTKSHARYVEASLIRAVSDNPRWTLPNANRPSNDAGKLPLPDRVAMDEFIDQTKTLVGALGWDLFKVVRGPVASPAQAAEAPPPPSPAAAERFSFRGEGFDAEMKIGASGEIIVTSGSKARLRTTPTIPKGTVAMRQMLQDRGVLKPMQDHLVFETEYTFSSPSAAAAVVTGASANGRVVWKLPDGRTYADWEDAQNRGTDISTLVSG